MNIFTNTRKEHTIYVHMYLVNCDVDAAANAG